MDKNPKFTEFQDYIKDIQGQDFDLFINSSEENGRYKLKVEFYITNEVQDPDLRKQIATIINSKYPFKIISILPNLESPKMGIGFTKEFDNVDEMKNALNEFLELYKQADSEIQAIIENFYQNKEELPTIKEESINYSINVKNPQGDPETKIEKTEEEEDLFPPENINDTENDFQTKLQTMVRGTGDPNAGAESPIQNMEQKPEDVGGSKRNMYDTTTRQGERNLDTELGDNSNLLDADFPDDKDIPFENDFELEDSNVIQDYGDDDEEIEIKDDEDIEIEDNEIEIEDNENLPQDITEVEIKKIATENGVDLKDFPMDELIMGYKVELEHSTGEYAVLDDPVDILKTALAHLSEFPDYYTQLKQMENEMKANIPEEDTSELKAELAKQDNEDESGLTEEQVEKEISNILTENYDYVPSSFPMVRKVFPETLFEIEIDDDIDTEKISLNNSDYDSLYNDVENTEGPDNDKVIESMKEWLDNIAENYREDIDTDIYSQVLDMFTDLDIPDNYFKDFDKVWQFYTPPENVTGTELWDELFKPWIGKAYQINESIKTDEDTEAEKEIDDKDIEIEFDDEEEKDNGIKVDEEDILEIITEEIEGDECPQCQSTNTKYNENKCVCKDCGKIWKIKIKENDEIEIEDDDNFTKDNEGFVQENINEHMRLSSEITTDYECPFCYDTKVNYDNNGHGICKKCGETWDFLDYFDEEDWKEKVANKEDKTIYEITNFVLDSEGNEIELLESEKITTDALMISECPFCYDTKVNYDNNGHGVCKECGEEWEYEDYFDYPINEAMEFKDELCPVDEDECIQTWYVKDHPAIFIKKNRFQNNPYDVDLFFFGNPEESGYVAFETDHQDNLLKHGDKGDFNFHDKCKFVYVSKDENYYKCNDYVKLLKAEYMGNINVKVRKLHLTEL